MISCKQSKAGLHVEELQRENYELEQELELVLMREQKMADLREEAYITGKISGLEWALWAMEELSEPKEGIQTELRSLKGE